MFSKPLNSAKGSNHVAIFIILLITRPRASRPVLAINKVGPTIKIFDCWVGPSSPVKNSLMGGKLHFHASIKALAGLINLYISYVYKGFSIDPSCSCTLFHF